MYTKAFIPDLHTIHTSPSGVDIITKYNMLLFGNVLHAQPRRTHPYKTRHKRKRNRKRARIVLFFRLGLDSSIVNDPAFQTTPIYGWNGSLLCGSQVDTQFCPFHLLAYMLGYESLGLGYLWVLVSNGRVGIGDRAYNLLEVVVDGRGRTVETVKRKYERVMRKYIECVQKMTPQNVFRLVLSEFREFSARFLVHS